MTIAARTQDLSLSLGLLVLRLGIGGYMLTHGIGKLEMLLSGQTIGDPIGLGPTLSTILVTLGEFGGSILVMVGLATRFTALLPLCSMLVAAFVVHASNPWTMQGAYELFAAHQVSSTASKEPALLYGIVFLALVLTGGGRFSVDAYIARRRGR